MEREEAREILRDLHSTLTLNIPMERKEQLYRELYKGTGWETYVNELPDEAVQAFMNLTEAALQKAVEELPEKREQVIRKETESDGQERKQQLKGTFRNAAFMFFGMLLGRLLRVLYELVR